MTIDFHVKFFVFDQDKKSFSFYTYREKTEIIHFFNFYLQ